MLVQSHVSCLWLQQVRRLLMRIASSTKAPQAFHWVSALLLLVFLAMSSSVLAQTANTGTLTGVAKDEKGAVIPGATVKAINVATNTERVTTTSGEGVFEIAQLVPGVYKVEVEATGFSKTILEDVVVNTLQRTSINPELKVGKVGETVTI